MEIFHIFCIVHPSICTYEERFIYIMNIFFKYCRAWSSIAWTCRHYIFISSWRKWMHCKMWVFFVIWWKSTRHHPLVITEKKKNGWFVFFTSWKELFLIVGANVCGLWNVCWFLGMWFLLHYSGRIFIYLLIYFMGMWIRG